MSRSRGTASLLARLVTMTAATALVSLALSCSKPSTKAGDASVSDSNTSAVLDLSVFAKAADARRAKDVPDEARTNHDVVVRRASARALARIADPASAGALLAQLADEDPETVAWSAYGLGYACKGHEDAHVKALAARAASLPIQAESRRVAAGRGTSEIDPYIAIARAIGRCGTAAAEQTLVALVRSREVWGEPAALGLGDLASRRKQLGPDAMTVLLDAASTKEAPLDLAFYPLSRVDAGEAFAKRVFLAASGPHGALSRSGEARLFAIKAVGRAGKETAKETSPELGRIVVDKRFDAAERAEAARALATLGEPGLAAAAEALSHLTPDRDAVAIAALAGPEFHVLSTLIHSLGTEPPKRAEASLGVLSKLQAASEPGPGLARRLAELRCAAALGLARGGYDAELIRQCDVETSETAQRTKLASLLRRQVSGERRAVYRALAKSDHLRVREEAVEAISSHAELGEIAVNVLADALVSKHAGLVATAADVIHSHPERVMVLADSERRAALDPKAPPPTASPAQEVSAVVGKALATAIAEPWPEDRFETRIALIEAASSVHAPEAKALALGACTDPNPVVRERALRALRSLGEAVTACNGKERPPVPAAELGATLPKPAKVVLTLDGSELAIVLEPELSPITATRIASLVRSGFFKNVVVHRVVPGFVVQFGDPDGDGYGGSGTSLRCETSPVSFRALDVGMALAGRDTGSSQLFVTLARTPHLDGEYTRVGHAEGDWSKIAQGDVIRDARVVE